ncbi:hypothetical protein [Myxococcus sp. MxC21-1]|uniref:hypothetical protein n=1 Tax=Myxococcus sp. MxC21-1 TaxID=3041439 RepID=UPI003977A7FC
MLVGDLLADDGELLLGRGERRLAPLEFEALGPCVELDEKVAFLDLLVEFEQREHDPARAGRLDAMDGVVWLDPGL